MKKRFLLLHLVTLLTSGCATGPLGHHDAFPLHVYHSADFDWASVHRVLMLPLGNETNIPQASAEMARELAAAFLESGSIEVVLAPPGLVTPKCDELRRAGKYDELELIELAHKYQVQTVLLGTLTEYRPYAPQRIGLSVQLISISEDIPIASIDGLWDATDSATAEFAQASFRRTAGPGQGLLGHDLVLSSPQQFQRFVCRQIVDVLLGRVAH